jgi:hypothetical protein
MNPGNKRRGVMSLKTLGRGFWIGLIASLILHALLIGAGRFHMQRWENATTLEARIEPAEFKAVPLPEPQAVGKPAAAPQPQPDSIPPEDLTSAPALQPAPTAEETVPLPAPPLPKTEQTLPLSAVEPPPQSVQPYAALTQAAQNIRELPAYIEIVYELNGFLSGRQTHVWQRTGQRYTLETEGEVTGLVGLFMSGKMIQKSRGRISSLGLMPEQYEMQRLSGKKESLRFDYDANLIESNKGKRMLELPLLTGAQDPLSSIYQLAMAARDDKDGFIVAASSKRVKGYPYRTLGTETLNTVLGELQTLHVTRAGDSEKGAVHLWLALERYALPVKVTYVDEDGTEWVLEAVSIKTQ